MSTHKSIQLGVDNYCFPLSHPCIFDAKKSPKLCFSFKLHGDFLQAGTSDDLVNTADYDALCLHLEKVLQPLKCDFSTPLEPLLKPVFMNFSPLITGCYLSITLYCHNTLTIDLAFDIPNHTVKIRENI